MWLYIYMIVVHMVSVKAKRLSIWMSVSFGKNLIDMKTCYFNIWTDFRKFMIWEGSPFEPEFKSLSGSMKIPHENNDDAACQYRIEIERKRRNEIFVIVGGRSKQESTTVFLICYIKCTRTHRYRVSYYFIYTIHSFIKIYYIMIITYNSNQCDD